VEPEMIFSCISLNIRHIGKCETSGSDSDEYEDACVLGYCAA
jgi:hypothetical protein